MQRLAQYIVQVGPVAAEASVLDALTLFAANPEAPALAVVQGGRPVGLLLRDAALQADSAAPLLSLAAPDPVVVDLACNPLEAAALAAADRRCDAFVVCSGERVAGVGTLGMLIDGLRRTGAGEPALARVGRQLESTIADVLAMTSLLERQPLGAHALAQVRAIREAGETARRRLQSAADLSLGVREARPEPVPLRELLDDVDAAWRGRAAQDGVTLLLSYDGDPDLMVTIDRARLRQVFDNLVEPALTFTRDGAVEVSLKAVEVDGAVHLQGRVRDSGPTLPADRLARIFDMADDADGWLGAAVARELVLTLGGGITAESNVGPGVTISFDFLCERAAPAVEEAPAPADGSLAAHILVVDDNATNRMVAEALVEMFDCTSECAEDGAEAVEIARSGRFDLILMDIKMPRMDGMAATRAIRALPGGAGVVPIVALTANVDPEDARAYLAAGMCDVVEKPIKPERLLQAIHAALAERESPSRSAAA